MAKSQRYMRNKNCCVPLQGLARLSNPATVGVCCYNGKRRGPIGVASIHEEGVQVRQKDEQLIWKSVSEDGPKDLGEFEAWCAIAHEHLRELVEFDHANPGELEETAYEYAANLVAKAGVFALAFGSTELYAICRARKAMKPGDAIICIGKCLDFCRGGRSSNEGKVVDSDRIVEGLRQLEERFGLLDANVALLVKQGTVKDAYTTSEVAEILGKAEFTVREYCRLGRIRAEKRACGRGRSRDWKITHAELLRIQNEGLLPVRKY